MVCDKQDMKEKEIPWRIHQYETQHFLSPIRGVRKNDRIEMDNVPCLVPNGLAVYSSSIFSSSHYF